MPTIAEALTLAVQHHRAGALHKAERLYREILQVDPQHVDALHLLGLIAKEVGRHDRACEHIRQAIRLKPDFAEAHSNLALVLHEQGKLEEALASLQHALRLKPDFAEAHNHVGIVLMEQGKLEEAVASLQHALRLKPDYFEGHSNLGNALREQGKLEEAVVSFQQALRLKPDYAEAHNNLGVVLREQGKLEEAVASLQQAIRFKPDFAEAHNSLGMVWLQQGDFERGWPEYEWRGRTKDFAFNSSPQPRWDGSPLRGKTILLDAEQGLGDTIQFIRYARLVKQRALPSCCSASPPARLARGRCGSGSAADRGRGAASVRRTCRLAKPAGPAGNAARDDPGAGPLPVGQTGPGRTLA